MRRRALAAFASVALLCGAQPVSAQESEGSTLQEVISANSGLILTLVVITTASTVTYITQGLTDRMLDRIFSDTQRYMNHNAAALSQDVTIGSGESLEDLATIYHLPGAEQPAFFERAAAEREALLPALTAGHVSAELARDFVLATLTEEQLERYGGAAK